MKRGIVPFLLAASATFWSAGSPARGDDRTPQIPQLKVDKYTLPNGLEVILHEDHTTPVVGVNLWYKVGSKNEKAGRTGFAHLFEHLMFQGSKNHDNEYFGPIEKVGAQINGSTSTDRTNYYENVPSNALELALWLEADRMGFLLPALTQAKLDNQRDVVKNERRQRYDNVPYGQTAETLLEALYPPEHPYHHSVIGSMADLSAASLDDVSTFFRTYYSPNNASLCIAGDFDPAETKRLVAKYFGPLPRGPQVAKLKPNVPVLSEAKHIEMTDRVSLPRVELVWPTGPRGDADEQALDVLSLVLGGIDKENRLFRALMYDRQLAAHVEAGHPASALAGEFTVTIYAQRGQSLDSLVKLADAEIERLKKEGPTLEEVIKAQNTQESQLVVGLQAAGRKADFLNNYNVEFGDPLAYKAEMVKLFKVTPEDVKRVANQYLTANRIRLDVNPGDPTPRKAEAEVDRSKQKPAESPKIAEVKDDFDRSKMPEVGPTPKYTPPPVTRRTLSNGLEVLIAERHELPILTLNLVVKGGEALVPHGKEGLASMTADLLTEGTKARNSLELAGALSEIGASINADGKLESTTLSLTTLTKHTARGLDLYTDVLLNPSFPEKELNRLRVQRLAMLKARLDSAEGISGVVFPRLLYGLEHPYGRPDLGTVKTINSLKREDVVAFHKALFLPNNASLIVVGDTTPEAITASLEKAIKDWKPGEAPKRDLPEPPSSKKPLTIFLVDKPAAAQSVLAVGQVGLPRGTPDYFPLTLMNAVLGGQFSSRINLNLREDKGYSYGVRSHFAFRIGPGPFEAGGSVQTAVTKEALIELLKELNDITGPRPVTDKELTFAKDRIIKGFPSKFETTFGVAGTMADLVLYSLPADYFATYQSKIDAVDKAEVARVAKAHLDPEHMVILVVGDRSKIEAGLKSLPYAKVINVLDPEGNPLPPAAAQGAEEGAK
ncbi:M16 family metallopeptidase [Singulisphaera acidiphila]|uniref:Putative Zn-dependent peptidase n=1 Tax=Singulisphaera acidiphila (strain ATCC BAA-1392 / DSM 18658 / VKM B-2454 / MOB10) TaxID=886293 RepID=L0D843_SINAD|nr:pitrilysin family protein [Singulisphaera acidiphila]AGA25040.1 putative Zn-dependent peptidase [Singulisphaera acidiphila DSM 18658]